MAEPDTRQMITVEIKTPSGVLLDWIRTDDQRVADERVGRMLASWPGARVAYLDPDEEVGR